MTASTTYSGVGKWLSRLVHTQDVAGSSPVSATIFPVPVSPRRREYLRRAGVDHAFFRMAAIRALHLMVLDAHAAEDGMRPDRYCLHDLAAQRTARGRRFLRGGKHDFQLRDPCFQRLHFFRQMAKRLPDWNLVEDFQNV